MTDDFNGSDVIDSGGNHIGTVERTYVDEDGHAGVLGVKLGTILAKHRLVPADSMTPSDDGIHLPWSKDVIESSPSINSGDTLEGDDLDSVRQYYAAQGSSEPQESEPPEDVAAIGQADQRNRPASDLPDVVEEDTPTDLGRVRDLGDIVEVPILEEVLVKKSIVRQVLRIRKTQLDEAGMDTSDLRQDRMEVIPNDQPPMVGTGVSGSEQ